MSTKNIKIERSIVKFFLLIFLTMFFLPLIGCENSRNSDELRHCVTVPRDALTSFSSEDEQQLFATFNIVVPEDETEVYVHSFSRRVRDYVGSYHKIFFTIELGGVKDYDAFYAANTGRIDENGQKGKAINQFGDYGSDFYIAYEELLFDDPQFLEEDDNQALYDSFNDLYESMSSKTTPRLA